MDDIRNLTRDAGLDWHKGWIFDGEPNRFAQLVSATWHRAVRAGYEAGRAGRGDAAGWVSVPREPTREMRLAGAFAPNHRTSEAVWRAMIAARPAAPTGEAS